MRTTAVALVVMAAVVSGCQQGDTDRAAADSIRGGADTTVRERTVQDTTIITHDTTVRSDTIVKRGGMPDSRPDTGAARRP